MSGGPSCTSPNRVVVPNRTLRDALLAGVAGVLAIGLLCYGVLRLNAESAQARSRTATGTVLEKVFTSAAEEQISVGSKGLKTKAIEGEYVLKVRVSKEDRVFEVPVEKSVYLSKKPGDSITFLRPPSER
jgi:hypothetical protein